jgi:hypothetical protein
MGDWEQEENLELRKAGATRFDDAVDDDVDDDWENDEEEQPAAAAPAMPVPEVQVKSAEEMKAQIEYERKIEKMRQESAEERKARVKAEQEAAAQRDVDDFFGDSTPKKKSEPVEAANAADSKDDGSSKGLDQIPLDRVEHFRDLADSVAVRVLSQKGSAQVVSPTYIVWFNSLK